MDQKDKEIFADEEPLQSSAAERSADAVITADTELDLTCSHSSESEVKTAAVPEAADASADDAAEALEDGETTEEIVVLDESYVGDEEWITPEEKPAKQCKILSALYDFVEMFALVTITIVLCFAFFFRLNIVDGPSMNNTLFTGEYLLVSDVLYEPKPGDIVVVHDLTAGNYTAPLVKRVIAVGGQTVDIDFDTWTLKVDGVTVDESEYRYLEYNYPQNPTSFLKFPLTVKEGHVFVMGDNRYSSADSRLEEIGQIDERCVVGKVLARVFPFDRLTVFKNPYEDR